MDQLRLGFVTCVQLGLSCMEAIYELGYPIKVAITLNDDVAINKSGRVFIDEICKKNNTLLLKVKHINDDDVIFSIIENQLDWIFIIGWSQIAGERLLRSAKHGVLGMHPTLLPVGRGRASIPWAILKRLPETGVTLFKLSNGIDTGPVIAQLKIGLPRDVNAGWLYNQVNLAHVELIKCVLPKLAEKRLNPIPQDENLATVWPGRKPEDGRIDLFGSVYDAECLVRAVTRPYPGAFVEIDGKKLIVWKAVIENYAAECAINIKFYDGILNVIDYEYL